MSDASAYAMRRALAATLRTHRDAVAALVTEEFLRWHPDWMKRYGSLASRRGIEDARFHVDFLAGAVEAGGSAAYVAYAEWTARVLSSRGIDVRHLIENLKQVGEHTASLLDGGERELVMRYTAEACNALSADAPPAAPEQHDILHTPRAMYLQAVLDGQRQAALTVALELLREGHAVTDVYCDVLQPAQYEIGARWERNEITVAREHMATAITQFVVAQLYSRLPVADTKRGRLVLSGVEGEMHQLGANMVADMLEADGWDVRFLGTQMPTRDILRAIEEHQPQVVGLSATMLFNLGNVADVIERLRSSFGGDVRIVLGGAAFRQQPDVWREIGADGFALDLRGAVAAVRDLTEG